MATQLQVRRGTTAQMAAFTGAEGELAVNTSTDTVHVHDGATAGGFALAKADGSNIGTYAGSFTTISASGAITANGGIDVTGTATMGAMNVTSGLASGTGIGAGGANGNLRLYANGAQVVTVATTGSVGIGTSSPSSFYSGARQLVVGSGSGEQGITVYGGNADTSYLLFADGTSGAELYAGQVNYSHANNSLNFITNGITTPRMTLDASGNLLVGKTVSNDNVSGTQIYGGANAGIVSSTFAGRPLYLNRLTTDGNIIDFAKDGAPVGSIGTVGGVLTIGNGDTGLLFSGSGDYITPRNPTTQAGRDAAIDLGTGSDRFKDLYLSGGVVFGATGGSVTSKTLDDYEEGTWTMGITRSSPATIFINNTTGRYTKIGSLVTVSIYTESVNVSSAGGGTIDITGLPFTVAVGSGNYSAASFAHTTLFSTTYEAYPAVNTNFARVTQVGSIANADLAAGSAKYMMFSLTYHTNQ